MNEKLECFSNFLDSQKLTGVLKLFEKRRKENPNPFPPICCGWTFSSVLSSSTGDVYTTGRSTSTGVTWIQTHQSYSYLRIPRLSNIAFKILQIAAGADHMLCLTSNYNVMAIGNNSCYQLGTNDPDILDSVEPLPVQMPNSGIVPIQVCCGAASSHVLTADGSVVGWGLNDCGQIGSGYIGNGIKSGKRKDVRRQYIPTLSPYFGPEHHSNEKPIHPISAMIKKMLYSAKLNSGNRGSNLGSKDGEYHHNNHHNGRKYGILLVSGDRHCGVVTDNGEILTWGCEERGRLGQGNVRSGTGFVLIPKIVNINDGLYVTKLAAGRSHMMCITDHYEVFSWGDNVHLQLGHGGGGDRNDKSRSPLWLPKLIPSLIGGNVIDVECSDTHSLALTKSGRVLSWGNSKNGRLGHGNELEVGRPTVIDGLLGKKCIKIACGRDYNLVVATNDFSEKVVYSWGKGKDGRLGSGSTHDMHLPTLITGIKRI